MATYYTEKNIPLQRHHIKMLKYGCFRLRLHRRLWVKYVAIENSNGIASPCNLMPQCKPAYNDIRSLSKPCPK
jgi:hypothetical protein